MRAASHTITQPAASGSGSPPHPLRLPLGRRSRPLWRLLARTLARRMATVPGGSAVLAAGFDEARSLAPAVRALVSSH